MEPRCDGCGAVRPHAEMVAFRPDGMGDVFSLCSLCRRAVAASEQAAKLANSSPHECECGDCDQK